MSEPEFQGERCGSHCAWRVACFLTAVIQSLTETPQRTVFLATSVHYG